MYELKTGQGDGVVDSVDSGDSEAVYQLLKIEKGYLLYLPRLRGVHKMSNVYQNPIKTCPR